MTDTNDKGKTKRNKVHKNQIMIMNMNDANRLLMFLDREGKILQARKVESGNRFLFTIIFILEFARHIHVTLRIHIAQYNISNSNYTNVSQIYCHNLIVF